MALQKALGVPHSYVRLTNFVTHPILEIKKAKGGMGVVKFSGLPLTWIRYEKLAECSHGFHSNVRRFAHTMDKGRTGRGGERGRERGRGKGKKKMIR